MDRDTNPSEQSTVSSTPPVSQAPVPTSFLDRFNQFAPIILVVIAMFTAITILVSHQTDLKSDIVVVKSEIKRVEQKIDTFQEITMTRFDTLEQILSLKVKSLEADNDKLKADNEKLEADVEKIEAEIDAKADEVNENTEAIDRIQQTLNESSQ